MNNTGFKALLTKIDEEKKQMQGIAQMKANDYVESNKPEDRASCKSYQEKVELWAKFRSLVMQYNVMPEESQSPSASGDTK